MAVLAVFFGGFFLLGRWGWTKIKAKLEFRKLQKNLKFHFSRPMCYKKAEYGSKDIVFTQNSEDSLFNSLSIEMNQVTPGIMLTNSNCNSSEIEYFEEQQICLNCHYFIQEGQMIIEIPKCCHLMHENCFFIWIKKNNSCPCCGKKFVFPQF